jgi:hypothetical protein
MIPMTTPTAPASPLSHLLEMTRQAGRQCEAVAMQNAGAQQAYQHVEREIERLLAPPQPEAGAVGEAMAMARSQPEAGTSDPEAWPPAPGAGARGRWLFNEAVKVLTDWDNLAIHGRAVAGSGADNAFTATHDHTREVLASLSAAPNPREAA